jgi:hypothetical protein
MKRALILSLLISVSVCVSALDFSASANALSGITLLSESVADCAISPVLAASGFNSFYYRPFNTPGIAIFGINSAMNKNKLHLALGNTYLYHEDYIQHNPYLNLNFTYSSLRLGLTGHMLYDSVQDADGEYEFSYDLGLAVFREKHSAELKVLRKGTANEQYSLSVMSSLSPEIRSAIGYVVNEMHSNFIHIGINAGLSEYLSLYSSWQNEPGRFGTGIRLNLDTWSVLYSIRTHPELDFCHAISLELDW